MLVKVLLVLAVLYLAVDCKNKKNRNKNKVAAAASNQEVDGVEVSDDELDAALGIWSMDLTNAATVGNAANLKNPKKFKVPYKKIKASPSSVLGALEQFGYMETVLEQTPEQSEMVGMIVDEDVIK